MNSSGNVYILTCMTVDTVGRGRGGMGRWPPLFKEV